MTLVSLRAKTPGQIAAIVLWKFKRSLGRRHLKLLRRIHGKRERLWFENPGVGEYILDAAQAREILGKYPVEYSAIYAEAQRVLSGWAEVPGFGSRRIELRHRQVSTVAENYAMRLLARLDFLRPLVRASLIADSASLSKYMHALETHLTAAAVLRAQRGRWDSVDDAIRILNIVETLALLAGQLRSKALRSGLEVIVAAAWNVEASRARSGNHLIYESLALLTAGTFLREYPRADRWRKLGYRLLEREVHRQVLEDGLHAELCSNYHLITAANFLKGLLIARKMGGTFSRSYCRKVASMARMAYRLQAADGGFFALGDSDRMSGASREEREGQALALLGKILCRAENPANLSLELEWLLAGATPGEMAFAENIAELPPENYRAYQILRSDAGGILVFDAGPFGLPGAAHHAHADSLAFEFHLPAARFLVDPGGFSYVDRKARMFARSTAAHNTVRIDGEDSTRIWGAFGFGRSAEINRFAIRKLGAGFVLTAEHDGYRRLPAGVIHRRGLIWMHDAPILLVVLDHIRGRGQHLAEAFYHADAGWQALLQEQDRVLWVRDDYRIAQRIRSNYGQILSLQRGKRHPAWQGWVSPSFGQFCAAPVLVVACRGEVPIEIVSVFYHQDEADWQISIDENSRAILKGAEIFLSWKWTPEGLEVDFSEDLWN